MESWIVESVYLYAGGGVIVALTVLGTIWKTFKIVAKETPTDKDDKIVEAVKKNPFGKILDQVLERFSKVRGEK